MLKVGTWILVAVILAASLVLVANIVSDTMISIKNKGNVSVKGFAKQAIRSDLGILEAVIVVENPELKTCHSILSQDKQKVESFLKDEYGITENELEFKPASISEEYKINDRGFATDEFIKFRLKQRFKLESKDVEKIAKISAGFIDILDEGVKIAIGNPRFIYTKLDDLKVEMIGRATNNARERAIKIAQEGKFRLGHIANVRVGIFQITPLHSTEVSNYGMNDTTNINKEIKSVVEIKYFVK